MAGLVIEGRKGQCYSCGCLIDGDMCRILSCKTDDDRSHNYQPYQCVFDQPALHRGVCIAALVCNDATENPPDGNLQKRERRHEALAHETEARRQTPQRFSVIVANGTPKQPSVVRFGGPPMCSEKDENAVRLYSWAELEPKH